MNRCHQHISTLPRKTHYTNTDSMVTWPVALGSSLNLPGKEEHTWLGPRLTLPESEGISGDAWQGWAGGYVARL